MSPTLKPLSDQAMVITGASSGIGLVTARHAARKGARVVLASRNEKELEQTAAAILRDGGRAAVAVADVSDPAQVDAIADTALREFGHLDTWVNNAAVSMYGRITDLPIEDMRRQMDVNFWGCVYGSLAAVRHLRQHGGALINVGSGVSDRAIPLQGIYCAAKHAVKGFTDTLRMELEEGGVPISVTLVKPASIDTPFFDKARSYLGVEPQPIPPVYAPEVVCDVILRAAEHPIREVIAGGAAAATSAARFAPRLADLYMERWTFASQRTEKPLKGRPDNLYSPLASDGGERGRNWEGQTHESSVYTKALLYPGVTAAMLAAVAVTLGAAATHRRMSG